jgi:hypothetical protein
MKEVLPPQTKSYTEEKTGQFSTGEPISPDFRGAVTNSNIFIVLKNILLNSFQQIRLLRKGGYVSVNFVVAVTTVS